MKFVRPSSLLAILLLFVTAPLWAGTPTRVMVRAVARDAKIIGDGVGGARIVVRDVATGKVLAKGVTQGNTGDTRRIMIEPRKRGVPVYDTPGAAGFLAVLDLSRPTVVEISAEGPLKYPQCMQKTSKTLLVVPGQDILGDGVVLEIHGFCVTIRQPAEGHSFKIGEMVPIRVHVIMT